MYLLTSVLGILQKLSVENLCFCTHLGGFFTSFQWLPLVYCQYILLIAQMNQLTSAVGHQFLVDVYFAADTPLTGTGIVLVIGQDEWHRQRGNFIMVIL